MSGVQFAESAISQHGALVRRVSAIAAAVYAGSRTVVTDSADEAPVPARTAQVLLERGDAPGIRREGLCRTRVVYCDSNAEATLGMVLAAIARPDDPIAADPESLSVFALADRLADSDIPVLINGPTGTGKEVLSRFIHARSDRADRPFVAVNCAAMPETMLEAMLFGHQKGAFTGATQASEGFFRAADGGTLLLDEIAEMPLALQAKLLRALQEQEVVPVGATTPIKVDVRIVACANRDLPVEVAEGRFRADLYYRLNVFPLLIRPLRERIDDIAPLAIALALRHAGEDRPAPCITEAALAALKAHSWPGNVRELENVVRRALLLAGDKTAIDTGEVIFDRTAQLVGAATDSGPSDPLADLPAMPDAKRKLSSIVQHSEARAIIETLDACNGSRTRAARELGISERTLRYRLASMREAGFELGRMAAGGAR